MAMNNSKFDKYLLRSFLKNTGLAIISISAIALVIFACYVVYIGIGKASTYVFNNFVLTLKNIGYIVLFLIALNLVICFIENVIKEANQKRSEDSSEDNV
ncbi:hypothetical protein N5J54_10385 [Acinetobacter ursingii]|uniref:Uncharacterized protein n=1 Tax=Acinetobacter johnsonii TaxID=40214 RepID=A0A7S9DP91_ACIJO|nr:MULTISPECIES: hypothetical protein [Acinetobacter]MDH2104135.1 hypothetical protein [Acinetobacter ursingii]QPG01363.1 hypothetical protein E10B_00049 [Acinetobacter johnsonii]RSC30205.1 hypothetical protein EGS47_00270 [Acinetobacter sp. FDAARGOS_515]